MLSVASAGLFALCVTAAGVTAGRHITTETLNGHVRGLIENVGGVNVATYLGIPYAEPPVGELRFRKPLPAKPVASDDLGRPELRKPLRPSQRPKPLGVLVWIHGGGYRTGTASQVLYDGKALSAVGDIVVVSINYRLGSLGFLYTGPGSSSGNYALWDQHLCLLWVRDNIARFGGDPGRVTVYGESAGSIGIGAQLVSPRNAGLIHRAIMASGSNYWLVPPQNAVGHEYADRIARHVGCLDESKPSSKTHPEQVIECLRSAPVHKIIDAEDTQFHKEIVTFTPSHGDDYLPLPEVDAISRGLFIPLESILAGATTEEGGVFLYFRVPSFINSTSAPKLTKPEVVDLLTNQYFGYLPGETRSFLIDEYMRRVSGLSDYSGNLKRVNGHSGRLPRLLSDQVLRGGVRQDEPSRVLLFVRLSLRAWLLALLDGFHSLCGPSVHVRNAVPIPRALLER
ncbi:hypothetical protein HPB51_005337 [Rhipicephalus microplus]|uniref:Carboxylic ester hydrolase n=1 Tax=Rhipicephalus microplus TaxID=6941 RepID=A0A9J6EY25_RHIMP|nr:hypothetical protein HPB51_005337 [Rhipicephalus microplus]